MEITEIKKILYKKKPVATRILTTGGHHVYHISDLDIGDVYFNVPLDEAIGFKNREPGQLLIRWLIKD